MPEVLLQPDLAVAREFLPKLDYSQPPEVRQEQLDSMEQFAEDFERKRNGIARAVEDFGTPFTLHDELGIRNSIRQLGTVFRWSSEGYRNHFASKATPLPAVHRIVKSEGGGADCSSGPELTIAKENGIIGEEVMFTSNNTPIKEFKQAQEDGAIINFDDITHIEKFQKHVGPLPEVACLRFNPGPLKDGNDIIGKPEYAKFGMTPEQLEEGYRLLKEGGVKRFGLHTMVVSNELNAPYFADTAEILFQQIQQISEKLGIDFEFVNLGGGFGIPYRLDQQPLDLVMASELIEEAYEKNIQAHSLRDLRILTEMGRFVTGASAVHAATAINRKDIYRSYIGLNSGLQNVMRTGIYDGVYHHVTVLGKDLEPAAKQKISIVGSLCENNDYFAENMILPEIEERDVLLVHDNGAHTRSMGYNYNGKLRSQEILLKADGDLQLIRRAETEDDYFATIAGL